MLALVKNLTFVSLVLEGSFFEHNALYEGSDGPEQVTATTGPAYDEWSGDGYELHTVTNWDIPEGYYRAGSDVKLVEGVWTETSPLISIPVPVPYSISKKQFYMYGSVVGMCTQDEALAAITVGTLPEVLSTILDGMSNPTAVWEAKMQLLGSNEFFRDSPWVLVIATVLGWTEEQIDQFWINASNM